MKTMLLLSLLIIVSVLPSNANILYPDSETEKSEVELGVEGIKRLCPTGMWDHWTFRDIIFDQESKSVVIVLQLRNWEARNEEKAKQTTDTDALNEAEWIVANFKEGYEELINNPSIQCDGDFMLYLSLGTLFRQMEKDGTNLRIMLLKPDYCNQIYGDIPITLSSEQLKKATSNR